MGSGEPGFLDSVLNLIGCIGSLECSLHRVSHGIPEAFSVLLDFPNHFQTARTAIVPDQQRTFRLEYAADFPKHVGSVIETMQRAVGNNKVKVAVLEAHASRVPHLKHGALVEIPCCSSLAGAVHHGPARVESHSNQVFVVPHDFQRDQSDASAYVQNDSAIDTQPERPRG